LIQEIIDTNSTQSSPQPEIEKPQEKKISHGPCIQIQEFVVDIEKLKWAADTQRLKKVGIYTELDREHVEYFNDRPFYPIPFEKSRLFRACNSNKYEGYLDSLDINLFKDAKSIWGYFYKDKDATDWVSDGVIEQWEFENPTLAVKAMKQISRPRMPIYFNTHPYYCTIGNKLIIFQTRASAFSYDQKPVFKKFVEEKSPSNKR
tara:strand:+ start:223 stop:834 length:612 start_codon:yes stop_codon:yes gene_type:complete